MFAVQVSRDVMMMIEHIEDAPRSVRSEIERSGWIGSTEWARGICGKHARVVNSNGDTVALVSYNGRLWNPDGITEFKKTHKGI